MSEEQKIKKLPYKPFVPFQGGLPKASVDILKKWLYENRYNPYASRQEKIRLSKMTNLTQKQIIDWMANSRKKIVPEWIREDGKDPADYAPKGKRKNVAPKGYIILKEPPKTEPTKKEIQIRKKPKATKQRKQDAQFPEAGCSSSVPVKQVEDCVPAEREQFKDFNILVEVACARSITVPDNQQTEDVKFNSLYILAEAAAAVERSEANKHQSTNQETKSEVDATE